MDLPILTNQLLYIDPAATTALITSITAVVLAIGASAIIIWRKLKKGAAKALHIDPNSNKEVEDEVVLLDDANEENKAVATELDKSDKEVVATVSEETVEEKTDAE